MTRVESYIHLFPKKVQLVLQKIRQIVKENAPGTEEGFSYGMPSYKLNGKPLVYFAAFKNHIGFYATPSGHSAFSEVLSAYKQGKGSVKFPLNKPVPFDLIALIVVFRAEEIQAKNKK